MQWLQMNIWNINPYSIKLRTAVIIWGNHFGTQWTTRSNHCSPRTGKGLSLKGLNQKGMWCQHEALPNTKFPNKLSWTQCSALYSQAKTVCFLLEMNQASLSFTVGLATCEVGWCFPKITWQVMSNKGISNGE